MADADLGFGIRHFARFILTKALALSSGQRLHILKAPVEAEGFIGVLKEISAEIGVLIASIQGEFGSPEIQARSDANALRQAAFDGDAFLIFDCTCAGLFDGMRIDSVIKDIIEEDTVLSPLWGPLSRNIAKWIMIAVPTALWAKKLYPAETPERGMALLWKDILRICKIDPRDSSFTKWGSHIRSREQVIDFLMQKRFKGLHFRNTGTDLTVRLADGYQWLGPRFFTREGKPFIPNLPMNEVFTAPHRLHVDGIVAATRPVVVNGLVIRQMRLVIKDGLIVESHASEGQLLLGAILKTDQGSCRFGEVALVPDYRGETSDIQGIYYATLFDENAGSHLAIGRAYRTSVANDLDDNAFLEVGGNLSDLHIDFTIGSPNLSVDGISENGESFPLIRDNRWIAFL